MPGSEIAPRALGGLRGTGQLLEAAGCGAKPTASAPCSPWLWATSLAPGREAGPHAKTELPERAVPEPGSEERGWTP